MNTQQAGVSPPIAGKTAHGTGEGLGETQHPKRVEQTVVGQGNPRANCWQACLAMMTGKDVADVIDVTDPEIEPRWWQATVDWAAENGFEFHRVSTAPEGYSIAVGYTSRPGKHACIYFGPDLLHDPHPSQEGLRQANWFCVMPRATLPQGEGR